MYQGWNGLEGMDISSIEHHQHDHSNMDSASTLGSNYMIVTDVTGFNEGVFGLDPLSQSSHYQCPTFPGMTHVDSYFRSDGTLVNAHWRTKPDGIITNNFSFNK